MLTGCTAERFFRIDRAQESLHYLMDITHDRLFVLDDPQRMPSAEEDVVTVVLKSKEEPSGDLLDEAARDATSGYVYFHHFSISLNHSLALSFSFALLLLLYPLPSVDTICG